MNILGKFKNIKNKIWEISREIKELKEAVARVESRQIKQSKIQDLSETEFKVYSQWGEDGIIQYLIDNINISEKIFIEFGVQNYTESNTRYLLINNNWSGLVIDGSQEYIDYIKKDEIYWKYNLKAECDFITAENINDIILRNGIKGKIGLLSVDIDGVDYWVWKAINCIEPDIVICEYNHRFGKEEAVTVPYKADFVRTEENNTNIYFGASIKALEKIAVEKGYSLVGVSSNGGNVFFVKTNLLNEKVVKKEIDEVFVHGKFRESRLPDGSLAYLDLKEEMKILAKTKMEKV